MALKFLNDGYFAGKVGIGVESPLGELHVKNVSQLYTDLDGTDAAVNFLDNNSDIWRIGIRASDNSFRFSQNATSLGSNVRLTIADGGNVGIGTTSPSKKLEVVSNTTYDGIQIKGSSIPTLGIIDTTNNAKFVAYVRDSDATIGMETNHPLTINTNNTERVRVTAAGKVGIGTTSPLKKLSINGGDVAVNNGNSFIVGAAITGNTQIGELGADSGQLQLLTESTRDIKFGSTTYGNIMFLEGTNGNVGIGTTSPAKQLVVRGSAPWIRIEEDSASNKRLDLWVDPTSAIGYIGANQSAQQLSFQTAGSDRIRILNNGNVGIGITTPQKKLSVYGDTLIESSGLTASLWFRPSATYGTGGIQTMKVTGSGNPYHTTTSFSNYDASNVLNIVHDKVGIGTTSPTAKLHVAGTGLFTGLVSGITPVAAANFVTKAYVDGSGGGTGPFLPLAGGTMTGDLKLNDAVVAKFGTGDDLRIQHTGNQSYIQNYTGDLQIQNRAADKDILFRADDGSGVVTSYLVLDGSTTHAYFSNPGNVGIGTTSPTSKLQVSGSGNESVEIKVSAGTTAGNTGSISLSRTDGSGNIIQGAAFLSGGVPIGGIAGGVVGSSNTSAPAFAIQTPNSTNGHIVFNPKGTEKMRITSGGNVGIGTTSPAYKLHVDGQVKIQSTNYEMLYLHQADANGGFIKFTNTDDTSGWYTGIAGTEKFIISRTADNSSPIITAQQNGYVGIGTDSPAAPLHVLDDSSANVLAKIRIQGGSTSGYGDIGMQSGYIRLFSSGSMCSAWTGSVQYNYINGSTATTLNSTGLGIGTTSPSQKLEVVGNIQATGTRSISSLFDANHYMRIESNSSGGILKGTDGGVITTLVRTYGDSYFNGGNVGIGTTSPGVKLHVSESSSGSTVNLLYLENTGSGGSEGVSIKFNPMFGATSMIASNREGADSGKTNLTFHNCLVNDQAPIERMRINSAGAIKFNAYGAGTLVSDASGNITVSSGGGAGGPYLPLAGSVYDGNTGSWSNGITGNLALVSTSGTKGIIIGDEDNGAGQLFVQFNSSNGGGILTNNGGNLEITAQNYGDGSDIIFKGNDTNNNIVTYFQTVGASQKVRFLDNIKLTIGNGDDLQIYHDGSNSYIKDTGTGVLYIGTNAFRLTSANLSENMISAFEDGAVNLYYNNSKKLETTTTGVTVTGQLTVTNGIEMTAGNFNAGDGERIRLGNSADFQIYHSGTHSFIDGSNGAGSLYIRPGSGGTIQLETTTGTDMIVGASSAVTLYSSGNSKLSTGAVSVGTATTAGGTLIDGWKTTTQANAINDTTIATTAYVNNKIALIPAGLVFQGTWNAASNSPTLTSGSGTTGNFYIVSTPGNTNLDGITDWKTGDWAVFIEQGASDQWEKIDNSSVLDGFGTGGSVAGWAGSGTSNTLTDAPITFSGNNTTFAGNVTVSGGDITASNAITGVSGGSFRVKNNGGTTIATFNDALNAAFAGSLDVNGNILISDTGNDKYFGSNVNLILNADADGNSGTSARNIIFKNRNSEKMRIDSAGNVGIGTTSPATKLQVNGGVLLGSTYTQPTGSSFTTANSQLILGGAHNSEFNTSGVKLLISGYNNDGGVAVYPIFAQDENGNHDFWIRNRLSDTALPRAYFAGDVGIGTTSPSAKLHIEGDGSIIRLQNNNSDVNGTFIDFRDSTGTRTGYLGTTGASDDMFLFTQASKPIRFFTNATERARITGAGNVGIGTTSPDTKLHVEGDLMLDVYNNGGSGNGIFFREGYGPNDANPYNISITVFDDGDGSPDALDLNAFDGIYFNTGSGTRQNRGYVDLSGNWYLANTLWVDAADDFVGIGTTSPGYKLTVSGGGIQAGGKVTYTKSAGSLNTTGYAVAGLTTSSNGQSAGFTFTCFGHTGGYQKIVYSCYNGSGTWVTKKVINEGTNQLDVVASANGTTITFTFKSISGTMSYTPRVTVEAVGTAINSTYA